MLKKKLIINTLAEVLPYFIVAALGLVKSNVILNTFGTDLLGNYDYMMTLLSFIFVGEAGLTGAIMFHLYEPFAKDDKVAVQNLYTASLKIFRVVGVATFGVVLLIAGILFVFPSIGSIVPGKEMEVIGTFLIISLAYSIPSFVKSHTYSALFASSQNQYVYSLIFNALRIVIDITTIILLKDFKSLYTIGLIILLVKIIEEMIVNYVGKRMFPWVKTTKRPDMRPVSTTLDLVRHHIGSMLVNGTDTIVLAAFVSASSVALYNTYFIVPTFLSTITGKMNATIGHALGNMFALESRKKMLNVTLEYISGMLILAFAIAITYALGGRSFVMAYRQQKPDFVVGYFVVAAFAFNLFILIAYSPLVYIISSKGLYRESRNFVFVAAVINVIFTTLSPFVFKGEVILIGAILATTLAYIATILLRALLIQKKIFPNLSSLFFVNRYIKYILVAGIIILILFPLEAMIYKMQLGLLGLVLVLGIIFLICLVLSTLLMVVLSPKSTKRLLNKILPMLTRLAGSR